jgi:methylmalonyl-CoA mutase, N-terminal domain
VTSTLSALAEGARGSENLMPLILNAVRAMATLGEISDTLRGEWGTFVPRG